MWGLARRRRSWVESPDRAALGTRRRRASRGRLCPQVATPAVSSTLTVMAGLRGKRQRRELAKALVGVLLVRGSRSAEDVSSCCDSLLLLAACASLGITAGRPEFPYRVVFEAGSFRFPTPGRAETAKLQRVNRHRAASTESSTVRSFLASGGEILEPAAWLIDLLRQLEGGLVAGGVSMRFSPKLATLVGPFRSGCSH
jgi:hypothetical protein